MKTTFYSITKSSAETAFVAATTLIPINSELGEAFLYAFVFAFCVNILTEKWMKTSISFLRSLREYLPSIGSGMAAHAFVLGYSGGPPIQVAIFGIAGVVMLLSYCFSLLIILAFKQ